MSVNKKSTSGMTLIELMIAMTVLVVGVAGIFTMFSVGFNTGNRAHDISMASIEAQLQFESLRGRPWALDMLTPKCPLMPGPGPGSCPGCADCVTWGTEFPGTVGSGFWVRMEYTPLRATSWIEGTESGWHSIGRMGLPAGVLPTTDMDGLVYPWELTGIPTNCNYSACVTNCNPNNMMLVLVTVYVYMNDIDAGNHEFILRHQGILNVSGRIL